MTPEEAVNAASLIGELWPSTPMEGTRKAFYANSLTAIPTMAAAVRAINALFVTERFQPPPGAVLDKALDLTGDASVEWQRIVQAATETQARSPVSIALQPSSLHILYRLCGGLTGLPLQDWNKMDRLRTQFITEHVEIHRSAIQKGSSHELPA